MLSALLNYVKKHYQLLWLSVLLVALNTQAADQYLSTEEFISSVFGKELPKVATLWVTKDIAPQVEKILGHAPPQVRQRYWISGDQTAWILDEIGKEEPITAGFVVSSGKIIQVKVLAYRENRGSEVHYPQFLKQYQGIELSSDNHLNRNIDGISGATLSVNALNRMARLALYYDRLRFAESH